VRVERITSYH